ncbi:hypothetical protein O181_081217 [Austropuccinia psidii MF-1]|uniref:Uncharacterized protein n=1 Tax=Austropuccinia psidii MF-1 TaxID=1389203 RepID=A0A9Q3FQB3_9BASI|nr:hypothetical protein [Austropuccinia psidii MF-1]
MASSGHFDPTQIYDGYKAVEHLDPACTEGLAKGKDCFEHYNPRSSNCHYCLIGKKPCCCTGNDQLDSEDIEVISHSAGQPSSDSPSQPPAKSSPVPPETSIPRASPHSSHTRPALNQEVRPSPIQQSRNSPMVNSQQLQPVASTSRRRDKLSPLLFPGAQAFQHKDQWPILVTIEDPHTASDNRDDVARLFRRVYRNSREVIMYANDRTIPGTASEEMAAESAWYEDELINYFQKTVDYLGRDNWFSFPCLCLV